MIPVMASENELSAVPPVIAIVGRPNVGKSSLFNAIVGRKLAIVHAMSGVTRDRVSADIRWQGRAFTLIDTGGLNTVDGMEKNVDMWDAGISEQAQCAMDNADALILVCDSQSGLTQLDIEVANRVRRLNKPVLVAANKCDLLGDDRSGLDRLRSYVTDLGYEFFELSAATTAGTKELMQRAAALLATLPPITIYEPDYVPPEPDFGSASELDIYEDECIAIEVKSGRRGMNSGLKVFGNKFHPKNAFVVGTDGIPFDVFFKANIEELF